MQMRRNGWHTQSEWGPTEQACLCRMQKNIGNIWKPTKNAVESTARICLLKRKVRWGPKLNCGGRGREQGTGKRENQALLLLRCCRSRAKQQREKGKYWVVLWWGLYSLMPCTMKSWERNGEVTKEITRKIEGRLQDFQLLMALFVIKLRAPSQALLWHWQSLIYYLASKLLKRKQWHGLKQKQVEGIFPLELPWVLTPFPQNSFGWEYRPRSSLCAHAFHLTDSKDPDIHVLDGWMPATKTHPVCTIHEDRMWLPQWLD